MVASCRVPRKYSFLRTDTCRGKPWRSRGLAGWGMASPMADQFGRTTSFAPSFSLGGRTVHTWEMLRRGIAVRVRQLCGHAEREADASRRTICNSDRAPALQSLRHRLDLAGPIQRL